MIEYLCPECDISELLCEIIPKKKCPKCGKLMEAIEED
jgi:rubrerythrin